MQEIWKDIEGYEGLYQISNLGRVKSLRNNIIRKLQSDKDGYLNLNLCNGQKKKHWVAILVATAFIENEDNKPEVNHKDGNKQNNYAENLEWVTHSENCLHAFKAGLMKPSTIFTEHNEKKKRKVAQYDLSGQQISVHDSIISASASVNGHHSNIVHCCQGKNKTAYGYGWKYAS